VKKASGEVGMYIIENLAPQNIRIATEIVSISVSDAKLFILPVWHTVSTSGLHPMLLSEVRQCRHSWKWIGRAQNTAVAAEITLISFPLAKL